jgi:hypothetical protein
MQRLLVGLLWWPWVVIAAPQQFEVRCEPFVVAGVPLHAAGVMEGPVNEHGILKPIRKRIRGGWVESYAIANTYPKSVWCGYGKLNAVIRIHPLPPDVKSCQVRYHPNEKVDKIFCVR